MKTMENLINCSKIMKSTILYERSYEYLNFLKMVLRTSRIDVCNFKECDWDFRIPDLVKKTLTELIFNPCGEFQWSSEGPVSQIHSPGLHDCAPGIFSDILRSVQMLKREWVAESNGKLPHLFIPSKTATMVPEFAVEDLPLGTIAVLVPELTGKELPLGRTLWWWWWWL